MADLTALTAEQRRQVEQHIPLVHFIAKRVVACTGRRVSETLTDDDIFQCGVIGLIEAVVRFDPEKTKFSTYATYRIQGAMMDQLRRNDWAPRSIRLLERHLANTITVFSDYQGREPNDEELAECAGITMEQLRRHRARLHQATVLSLDKDSKDGLGAPGELTLIEMIPALQVDTETAVVKRELRNYLDDALGQLTDRQRTVVVGFYCEGRKATEMAAELGVTQSRVSQIKAEACELIRLAIEEMYEGRERTEPKTPRERRCRRYVDSVQRASTWRERLEGEASWPESASC